jgi:flagellar hook-basal body complex protein FliE
MTTIDSSRMLLQLRALAAEAGRAPLPAEPGAQPLEFGAMLAASMRQVNELQQGAAQLATAFERGEPGVDITRVMVEAQKASLSFRAMAEVRNRLVSAYQDVMNMPI